MPSAQGADYAYDILVIEASSGKAKPATLAISIMGDKPGEIAFGRMLGESFVGQRLMIRSPDKHTKKVEVVAEDVESPVADKESGTTTQQVHKKIITLEADGKSHTVEVNGRKLTFRVYTIGGIGDTNKVLIESGPRD